MPLIDRPAPDSGRNATRARATLSLENGSRTLRGELSQMTAHSVEIELRSAEVLIAGTALQAHIVAPDGRSVELPTLTVEDGAEVSPLKSGARAMRRIRLSPADAPTRARLWWLAQAFVPEVDDGGANRSLEPLPGRGLDSEAARQERLHFVRERTGTPLVHGSQTRLDPERLKNNIENMIGAVEIPVGVAGPLWFRGEHARGEALVPMATTEGALVASTTRGARALTAAGGVTTRVLGQRMIRAPYFCFEGLSQASLFTRWVADHTSELMARAAEVSRHGRLSAVEPVVLGREVHLRFVYETGDAAGQNMTTACTWHACQWILQEIQHLPIRLLNFLVEGNLSSDKKASFGSFVNGRGLRVTAEAHLDGATLRRVLKVEPEQLLRTYNACVSGAMSVGAMGHNANVANVVAAVFSACGQDIACVHESSLGIYQVVPWRDGVYVSMVLPSLVIGTVGGGTHLPQQHEYLEMMGCAGGDRVARLGEIIAGFCLALDLSTGAAVASGHFASAHERLGRNRPVQWLTEPELDASFFQRALDEQLGASSPRVQEVAASKVEIGSSMITELSARRSNGKLLGFFPRQLRVTSAPGETRTLDVLVKVKALSDEALKVIHAIAPASGPEVVRALTTAERTLDITDCHSRELAIYRQRDPRFTAHAPTVYGVVEDPEREIYALILERLQNLELMNSVDDIAEWTAEHRHAAIRGAAEVHAIWYEREEELLQQPWIGCPPDLDRMREGRALWQALATHAHGEFPEWVTRERHAVWQRCLARLDETYAELPTLPRTLVHGDFNPRNIGFRREATGLRLCAYDWELATLHVPQRDLAELMAFTLEPAAIDRAVVEPYLQLHRRELERTTGATISPQSFERGFVLALRDLLVTRLALYCMSHTCYDYRFLPRVFAATCRLLEVFDAPRSPDDSGAFLRPAGLT